MAKETLVHYAMHRNHTESKPQNLVSYRLTVDNGLAAFKVLFPFQYIVHQSKV